MPLGVPACGFMLGLPGYTRTLWGLAVGLRERQTQIGLNLEHTGVGSSLDTPDPVTAFRNEVFCRVTADRITVIPGWPQSLHSAIIIRRKSQEGDRMANMAVVRTPGLPVAGRGFQPAREPWEQPMRPA